MKSDYYAVLGVGRSATLVEIKAAYRRQAKHAHPMAGGTDQAFVALKEACDVLTCPQARAAHDRDLDSRALVLAPQPAEELSYDYLKYRVGGHGKAWARHDMAWARFEWERLEPPSRPDFNVFERRRTAERMHARETKQQLPAVGYPASKHPKVNQPAVKTGPTRLAGEAVPRPARVEAYRTDDDPAYSAWIDLRQCYEGVRIYLRRQEKVRCRSCGGNGFSLVDGPTCSVCAGTGHAGRRGFIGRLVLGDPCGNCGGSGRIQVPKNCLECSEGVATVWHETSVDVVRGAVSGSVLSLPGSADRVEVLVSDMPGFTRGGDDVLITGAITATQARKGAALTVECLNGSTVITVPAGASDGDVMTVPRRGMPRQEAGLFGDMLVTLKVRSPGKRSARSTG